MNAWMRLVSALALLALGSAPTAHLLWQRDVTSVVPRGTARITGVVMTDEREPQPVRKAIVSLSGDGLPLGRHAISDDNGRFEIDQLPAGRFTLSASRPGYVTIAYGATRPGRPGSALVVGAGQQMVDVPLRLIRGSVITGTIRDSTGEPAMGVDVRVERRGTSAKDAVVAMVKTDDRGVYRVFGLGAGEYVVSARPQLAGIADLLAPSEADVDATMRDLRLQTSGPRLGAPNTQSVPPPTAIRKYNLATVFYPGVLSAESAAPVKLAAGEERSGVDIGLLLVAAGRVEGSVVVPAGWEMSWVSVIFKTWTGLSSPGVSPLLTPKADGSFSFSSVPPGRYMISAKALTSARDRALVGLGRMPTEPEPPGACAQAASEVNVVGDDVLGVSLVLRPCTRIVGQVVFSGSTLERPSDLTRILVTLQFLTRQAPSGVSSLPTRVRADGSFEIGEFGHLMPGEYGLTADAPSTGSGEKWSLRSVLIDGRDVLDLPFVVLDNAAPIANAVVTFSDRPSSLSGSLQASSGLPAIDYTVVMFTANREWWARPFRRVRTARPGSDGAFRFDDVPPGTYYLAALIDVEPDDTHDAAFLAELVSSAIRLEIGDGERKVQNLRIVK